MYPTDNLPYEKIGKNEPVCIADEVPFDIPESWEWVRLANICTKLVDGDHNPPKGEPIQTSFIMASSTNINNDTLVDLEKVRFLSETVFIRENERTQASVGDIFFTSVGSLGRSCVYQGGLNICFQRSVSVLTTLVYNYYLKYFFDSGYVQQKVFSEATGTAQKGFYLNQMAKLIVPVPPLPEQHRIVEGIRSILPLLTEYSKKEIEISALQSSFPDHLKKSILQEAVQGKLVPQDPADEPASVLLERIRAEKEQLIKAGKIKRDKHESVIFRRDNSHYEKRGSEEVCIDEELPFEIPETWQWVKLSDLVQFIGGYAYKSETFIEKSEYQVLRLGNVKNDEIKYSTKPVFISKELAEQTADFQCQTNDILITMTGTRLKRDYFYSVLISEKDANCFINQRVGCLRCYIPTLSRWLIWALKSEGILSQVFLHETGTANQGNLGAENIMKTFIPLPPLDEQIRICNMIECLSREVNTL